MHSNIFMENLPKALSSEQLRRLDRRAKDLGMGETILIENASSNLFGVIDKLDLGKKALVISGRGNNGADVLSCARKLFSRGYEVKAAVLQDKPLGSQAYLQKSILDKIKVPVAIVKPRYTDQINIFLQECDFVLDGILGIGVKGEISDFFKAVISLVNQSGKKIVSCDIPSGLSPDEGVVLGEAIKADYTVSFIAPKKGFFVKQGPNLCGKIFVADIGISKEILEKRESL